MVTANRAAIARSVYSSTTEQTDPEWLDRVDRLDVITDDPFANIEEDEEDDGDLLDNEDLDDDDEDDLDDDDLDLDDDEDDLDDEDDEDLADDDEEDLDADEK